MLANTEVRTWYTMRLLEMMRIDIGCCCHELLTYDNWVRLYAKKYYTNPIIHLPQEFLHTDIELIRSR